MITKQEQYQDIVSRVDNCRDTHNLEYLSELKKILGNKLKFQHEMEVIYKKTPNFLPLRNDRAIIQNCIKYINKLDEDLAEHITKIKRV